jgi:hypothetical protein
VLSPSCAATGDEQGEICVLVTAGRGAHLGTKPLYIYRRIAVVETSALAGRAELPFLVKFLISKDLDP